ncbi:hypothetical protein LAZ29_03125 [Cereibacter sphaeroides]|uniref:hypothetical protein n=1 Tax=Cereibacter sphaeroides TaxID=1063 RepID=UPI001F424E5E|nr:hypothetical protein [Cereibacter sphaeroides]MCE6949917.1 hypothetical protein [Cereibacter sphaeroides]
MQGAPQVGRGLGIEGHADAEDRPKTGGAGPEDGHEVLARGRRIEKPLAIVEGKGRKFAGPRGVQQLAGAGHGVVGDHAAELPCEMAVQKHDVIEMGNHEVSFE